MVHWKKCRSCEVFKQKECFHRHGRSTDGLKHDCKICNKVRSTFEREMLNPEFRKLFELGDLKDLV